MAIIHGCKIGCGWHIFSLQTESNSAVVLICRPVLISGDWAVSSWLNFSYDHISPREQPQIRTDLQKRRRRRRRTGFCVTMKIRPFAVVSVFGFLAAAAATHYSLFTSAADRIRNPRSSSGELKTPSQVLHQLSNFRNK